MMPRRDRRFPQAHRSDGHGHRGYEPMVLLGQSRVSRSGFLHRMTTRSNAVPPLDAAGTVDRVAAGWEVSHTAWSGAPAPMVGPSLPRRSAWTSRRQEATV